MKTADKIAAAQMREPARDAACPTVSVSLAREQTKTAGTGPKSASAATQFVHMDSADQEEDATCWPIPAPDVAPYSRQVQICAEQAQEIESLQADLRRFKDAELPPAPAIAYTCELSYAISVVSRADYNALRTFCAKQAAEIEQLRDDAERYRWLRTSERFTAVIDAARKGQPND